MPKSLASIEAHIDDIVEGRQRAKDARFKPLPPGVERVTDVLASAIDFLEARLSGLGFKAARSRLSLSRKRGEITQVVGLQPSATNLSGASVEVTAHALVRSSGFKRWTGNEGTRYAREHLWTCQLGYLGGQHEYLKWQLVDPGSRDAELQDLLARVQSLALPAFEAWATRESIASAVFRFTEIERIDWLVEAALWAGSAEAAARLLSQHLARRPQDAATFAAELARFSADPRIMQPLPYAASGLAFLAARHGLRAGQVS